MILANILYYALCIGMALLVLFLVLGVLSFFFGE